MAFFPSFFGWNFTFWAGMSFSRYIADVASRIFYSWRPPVPSVNGNRISPDQVAVILAAHNEELALPHTLTALVRNLPPSNIYVASDGSTDKTVDIARKFGCNVTDLNPNRGKAKSLTHLLRQHKLLQRYQAILIMDAEVIVSDNYLSTILPYFNDPGTVAFVSHAVSYWQPHRRPRWSLLFTAYRIRLWLMLYYGLRYGQTWKYFNVTPIIPGGSSVYLSSALQHIEIDTPGLIIEDFHMTFQVHHKRLGKIASHPSAYIIDQEPYSLRDYARQVHRWFLGFWQTYLYHGFWPSLFWFATTLFLLEMLLFSLILLMLPVILVALLIVPQWSFAVFDINISPLGIERQPVTILGIIGTLFVLDYFVTVLVAWIEAKPLISVYGLGFIILRYVDVFIFLMTLPEALLSKGYSGTWHSPQRRSPMAAQ